MADLDDVARETAPLKAVLGELEGLADDFGRAMTTAFRRSVIDGKRLESVLKSLALSLSGRALNAALAPLGRGVGGLFANLLGGLFKGIGFAKGGVIGQGVMPFAAGGVVRAPTGFAMRGGVGLMGEAGPEAILPLARGPDGRLGVRGGGGRAISVTFNVTTPDAASFRRAETEISAMLARAVARGQRGL